MEALERVNHIPAINPRPVPRPKGNNPGAPCAAHVLRRNGFPATDARAVACWVKAGTRTNSSTALIIRGRGKEAQVCVCACGNGGFRDAFLAAIHY